MTREVYPILGKLLKFIQTQHRVVFSITVGFKSYNSALIRRVNLTSKYLWCLQEMSKCPYVSSTTMECPNFVCFFFSHRNFPYHMANKKPTTSVPKANPCLTVNRNWIDISTNSTQAWQDTKDSCNFCFWIGDILGRINMETLSVLPRSSLSLSLSQRV